MSTAIAFALTAMLMAGCSSSATFAHGGPSPSEFGSLTERQFNVAHHIARAEADKAATSITSATATVGAGTETAHNAGPPCTSGTLLHIKLIGAFRIVHGGVSGQPYEPVSAVLITADPKSGKSCLLSVKTGQRAPDPGATVLFTH